MKKTTISLILLTAVALGGCGQEDSFSRPGVVSGPVEPAVAFPDSMLFDAWVLEEGEMFPDLGARLDVTAFELDTNGHARIYFRETYTQVKDCVRAFALSDDRTLVFDLGRELGLIQNPERASFFPVTVVENDFLGMSDDQGRVALFSRQPLPPELSCPPIVIDAMWSVPAPHPFGSLQYWQDDLIYNSMQGNIERFDLESEQLETPLAPTENRFLVAIQGNLFWTHCGCGGSPDATLRDLNYVYDTVGTGSDLGFAIAIRAGAFETSTGRLWLHGVHDTVPSYLLEVQAGGEPDELISTTFFEPRIQGMTYDGTDFWANTTALTQSISRIDPETKKAIESFEVPDEDVTWSGLTFTENGNLFLIGTDNQSGQGILARSPGVTSGVPHL